VQKWSMGYENALETAATRALSLGLRPRMTPGLSKSFRAHAGLRRTRTIPLPLLSTLLEIVLPRLSVDLACKVFRASVFLFRGTLAKRTSHKLAVSLTRDHRRDGPYEEYRRLREGPDASRTSAHSSLKQLPSAIPASPGK
jgi:hypothetical protein